MGAIGGIFSYTASPLDPMLPVRMSRSMTLRGGEMRAAYIKKRTALLQNMTGQESRLSLPRPLTRTVNGYHYTVVADGMLRTTELSAEAELLDAAEQTLEAYIAFGTDVAQTLCGSFALAILDERRSELLLLCGAESGKPLFFVNDREQLAFASELKALLRFFPDGIRIERERLWDYLRAPAGSVSGASLYDRLSSLSPCTGAVCSAMGLSRFSYPPAPILAPTKAPSPITPPLLIPEVPELAGYLTDILFAFDYPQFDPWMPGVIQAAKQSADTQSVAIGDPTLYIDLCYAAERADRLGALCGTAIVPIPPQEYAPKERELKKLDRALRELLDATDLSLLVRLFGAERLQQAQEERNLAKRIRLRGMLYQTLLWAEHYPLVFI